MHYQAAPHEEHKLVRCTAGAIFDAIVDLRTASPTYRRWFAAELTMDNRRSLFIPRDCPWVREPHRRHRGVLHDLGAYAPTFSVGSAGTIRHFPSSGLCRRR